MTRSFREKERFLRGRACPVPASRTNTININYKKGDVRLSWEDAEEPMSYKRIPLGGNPMNRKLWLWAALVAMPIAVAASVVYANAQRTGYTCPITGEQLPCPGCCPLNKDEQQTEAQSY